MLNYNIIEGVTSNTGEYTTKGYCSEDIHGIEWKEQYKGIVIKK